MEFIKQFVVSRGSLDGATRVYYVFNPSLTSHVVECDIIAATRLKELRSSSLMHGHQNDRDYGH